jgi:hypothetical protein
LRLRIVSVVTQGTAAPVLILHCPDHTDAMLQRDGNRRSNMERTDEKSIELTMNELDIVSGGKVTHSPWTLPTNPFSPPSVPKSTTR